MNSFPQNPFTRSAFWDRRNELRTIYKRLLSESPQCCAIIGETHIGKTTLLRYLTNPQSASIIDDWGTKHELTFVYLNCLPYVELAEMGDYASVRFWWDLYSALWIRLQLDEQPAVSEPKMKAEQASIDTAFEIKSELDSLIRRQQRPVVFLLDNFDGIARLPLRDSDWLRSMTLLHCAYVVTSRHLLYLLYQYHPESGVSSSPLWNLFSDPIYLGLLSEDAVQDILLQASKQARELEIRWEQRDIDFIRTFCGRHPELIRIACAHLFEQHLQADQLLQSERNEFEDEFLEFSIYKDASPICNQLWLGLTDPELRGEPRIGGYAREKEIGVLSQHQKALIDVAKGYDSIDKKLLFLLEQRGLIERVNGEWRVFAEVMRQFVLEQVELSSLNRTEVSNIRDVMPANRIDQPTRESWHSGNVLPDQGATRRASHKKLHESPAFTYLEGKVYEYLKSHAGDVCDREEIKRAVWGDSNPPTDSAVQKIIERIREKIELDAENPRYLIAVRGQGYMLRED